MSDIQRRERFARRLTTAIAHPLGVAAVTAYVAWIDRLQIPPGEAALATRFPVAFPEYTRRVRRWL